MQLECAKISDFTVSVDFETGEYNTGSTGSQLASSFYEFCTLTVQLDISDEARAFAVKVIIHHAKKTLASRLTLFKINELLMLGEHVVYIEQIFALIEFYIFELHWLMA